MNHVLDFIIERCNDSQDPRRHETFIYEGQLASARLTPLTFHTWFGEHFPVQHSLPARVPSGNFIKVWSAAQPCRQHLHSRERRKEGGFQ